MIEAIGNGISCIDTGYLRPGLAASFLLQHGDEAAIIETGTPRSVGRILRGMAAAGVAALLLVIAVGLLVFARRVLKRLFSGSTDS